MDGIKYNLAGHTKLVFPLGSLAFPEGELIMTRICIVAIACMMLGACATSSSTSGRLQLTAPTSVSAVYSEVNMQLSLVTEANTGSPCAEAECMLDRAFDQSVLRIGSRLAQLAFDTHPDLAGRFGKFEFVIAEKSNPGSISNAVGKVVIFRGVQKLHLSEKALAFLIAREMGHVIARHHDEKSATSIAFSVLAAVFMPITSIISGPVMLSQAASATTASTAAVSAASFIGSKVTIESYKLDQLYEADAIALDLLGRMGWSKNDIAYALLGVTLTQGDDNWSNELRASAEDVAKLTGVQNSITDLKIVSSGKGKTVIKVGLAQPLNKLPAGFTTADPPCITFDFLNTTNGMGKSVQDFTEKNMRSANITQATGSTRLAINLNHMLSYNTKIDGSSLLITLQGKTIKTAMAGNTPRFAKTDTVMRQAAQASEPSP